jgi:histidine triad (HIT) family protein
VFCGIVAGSVSAEIVSTSALAIAFHDRAPVAPTHVLVVPREHLDDAAAVGTDHGAVLAEMLVLARQVAEVEGVAASGYRLVMNVGRDSGNSVGHLHLHLIGGRPLGPLA